MGSSTTSNNPSPLFEGNSDERPSLLTISFASDPTASLGVQLASHDNGLTNEMFLPGYASVGGVPDSGGEVETLAKKFGVKVGDYIVAVNGEGYRRFPPDFEPGELEDLTAVDTDLINLNSLDLSEEGGQDDDDNKDDSAANTNDDVNDDNNNESSLLDDDYSYKPNNPQDEKRFLQGRVIHPNPNNHGEVYDQLLSKIRTIKSARDPNNPLILSFERYMWDSRVHSWSRFLSARKGNVPEAMTMIQGHERWRNDFFPIDLTDPNLQRVLRAHAVSEVDIGEDDKAAVVYIDFSKLQQMVGTDENSLLNVVQAFVIYTETLLSRSPDPRSPKTSQFIDLTGVNLKQGFRVNLLKKLYRTFEPNYPETLERMVLYPVPKALVSVVNAMLGFVNEHTRKKFVITDDLFVVCKELGWNLKEIEVCGGVRSYMKKHLKHGLSFVFE